MITCPECQTEYEKEAKYCFKCRIPFTDDIPESISKYLKQKNPNGIGYLSKSHTSPITSSGHNDKPPLQRNISVPTMKSGTNSNNIYISSQPYTSSPPTTSYSNSTSTTTTNSATTTTTNRPRMQSSPVPPTHPLPPTPSSRMSVPVSNNTTSPTIRHPPPPPNSTTPTTNTSPIAGTNNTNNIKTVRTTSPINTPPTPTDSYSSPNMSGGEDNGYTNSFAKRPLSRRIPPPPPGQKLVRAVWDCVPEEEGDLAFSVGDIISVITKDEDTGWWMGTCHGRTGLFPGNYTVPLSDEST